MVFPVGRSIVTQLLLVCHWVTETLAYGKEIDPIYLGFPKTFDKVPHCALPNELTRFGMS